MQIGLDKIIKRANTSRNGIGLRKHIVYYEHSFEINSKTVEIVATFVSHNLTM